MPSYPHYRDSGVPWLGEVPEHWDLKQLGLIGSLFKGSGGTKEDEVEDGVPCVRYGDIYTQHRYFIRETRADITEESAAKYTPIRYGDILFAGSGETIEEIGKSAANLIEGPAYCGGDVIVFRPSIEADATFLGYAADCSTSIYQKACMGRGVTVMHIYGQELRRLLLPLPPLDEQRAIAAFLDRETERIDALVAKKRLLIERLEEYRTALITRTVTRGLPPEAAHAAGLDPSPRLKPSGVEWLGEVPEHWEVNELRRLLAEPLKYGANEAAELDDPAFPRYVRITDIDDAGALREETFRSLPPEVAAPYLLEDGDVLLGTQWCHRGEVLPLSAQLGNLRLRGVPHPCARREANGGCALRAVLHGDECVLGVARLDVYSGDDPERQRRALCITDPPCAASRRAARDRRLPRTRDGAGHRVGRPHRGRHRAAAGVSDRAHHGGGHREGRRARIITHAKRTDGTSSP